MSIPSLSSHLIASASCYRHDHLVMDRRSTATLICDGAARSCFHTQASLSRSVIGSASSPGGGSKQIDSARLILSVPLLATACRTSIMGALRQCGQFEHSLGRAARLWSVGVGVGPCPFRDEVGDQHGCCSGTRDRQPAGRWSQTGCGRSGGDQGPRSAGRRPEPGNVGLRRSGCCPFRRVPQRRLGPEPTWGPKGTGVRLRRKRWRWR